MFCVFFFKQKTAYEMRISDWSSDVCSSDLGGFLLLRRLRVVAGRRGGLVLARRGRVTRARDALGERVAGERVDQQDAAYCYAEWFDHGLSRDDRKSVGEGKSVSVRVDLGGRRSLTKKNNKCL